MYAQFEHIIKDSFNYEEALVRQKLKHEDVVLLREKIKRSKIVPRFIHDKTLLLFVNACKDDLDKSSKWLHIFYKMKRNSPEYFKNRDVASEGIQRALDNQVFFSLPVTPDNHNVVLHKLSSFDPKNYLFDESIKAFIMTGEACTFYNGPRDGTIFIFDFEGGGFRHLLKPSISSVRKAIDFLQAGSPLNVRQIHFFNAPYFVGAVLAMIRPFLRRDLYERINFHVPGTDYEEFFAKFIPRSHMPSDYGGDLGSIKELHKQNRKLLMDLREYFLFEEDSASLKYEYIAKEFEKNNNEVMTRNYNV